MSLINLSTYNLSPYIFAVAKKNNPNIYVTPDAFSEIQIIILTILFQILLKYTNNIEEVVNSLSLRYRPLTIQKSIKSYQNKINNFSTRSKLADLIFSVYEIENIIKDFTFEFNFSSEFVIYLTAILESLTRDIIFSCLSNYVVSFSSIRRLLDKDIINLTRIKPTKIHIPFVGKINQEDIVSNDLRTQLEIEYRSLDLDKFNQEYQQATLIYEEISELQYSGSENSKEDDMKDADEEEILKFTQSQLDAYVEKKIDEYFERPRKKANLKNT